MFKWFKNLKESYNITKMNKINYNNFVHDMQQYEDNEQSMFNQLGLIFSKDKTKISQIIQLPENFAQYPDERLINLKINELIKPASDFILYQNNWFEYVIPAQIYHIEEAGDNGVMKEGKKVSLTYVAVWEWSDIEPPIKHWKCKLFSMIFGGIVLLSVIITSLVLFI